jgi:hypothetical protein
MCQENAHAGLPAAAPPFRAAPHDRARPIHLPIVGRVGRPLAITSRRTPSFTRCRTSLGVFIDGRFIDGTLAYSRTVQADAPLRGQYA